MCRKTPFDKVKFEFRYAHSRGQKLFFQFWCFLNVDFHCNCGAVLFMSALARIGLPGCVHYSPFFSTGCSNWLEPRCPRAKSGWSQTCSCPWGVCHWCCMLDSMFCPELCDRMRTYNRVKKVCHPQYRLHPVTQICSGSRRKSLANGTCWWFRPGVAGRPPEGLQVISRV